MSIEYEVRSDDSYSRHVSALVARELLEAHWDVKGRPDVGFLYQGDRCHVEIQFGAEGSDRPETIQCRIIAVLIHGWPAISEAGVPMSEHHLKAENPIYPGSGSWCSFAWWSWE